MNTSQNPLDALFEFARTQPLVPAVVGAKLSLNYGVFADTVKRFAAKLRSQGVSAGQVVGVKLRPELQAVAIAAVMHEGATSFAATPAILASYGAQIDWVITEDQSWLGTFRKAIQVDADWLTSLAGVNPDLQAARFESSESLALLVFSSGTTGIPKGVEFSIDDLHTRTDAAADNWMPAHPFFAQLGLDTVSGIQTYFWSILNGKTYYLPTSAAEDVKVILDNGIRSIKTSPAKLADLVRAAQAESVRFSLLEQVQVAGGLLSPGVANALESVSNAELYYLYGSTEAGTVTKGRYDASDPELVGEVVPGADVQIVDELGAPCQPGQSGVLRMRTPYQAKRYWRVEPSATTGFHDGWFLPGDTATLDSAHRLRVTGRVDELINAAGVKLNPASMDAKLAEYRGLEDFAFFGYLKTGHVTKSLGLAIVTKDEVQLQRLEDHVKSLIPEVEEVLIIRLREVPRNALGKPQRSLLSSLVEGNLNEQ